jgi:hypothetical protein
VVSSLLQDNAVLRNAKGLKITENYGLFFEGFLALQNPSDAGIYQFSMLADDGAVFEILVNGKWQTLMDYQGPRTTDLDEIQISK